MARAHPVVPRTDRAHARLRRWIAAGLLFAAAGASQALTVFACEPEWAALVQQLAPQAQVRSATHAGQDPHHIEARPSLIATLRRADLAVCTGASLESGWLPMLQQRAGNARVQDGQSGMFYAADHVTLIDPRPPSTPWDGDVHAEGNPHVQLDPERLLAIAQALSQRLQQIEPARAAEHAARWQSFERDWRARMAGWRALAAPLRGTQVAAQHTGYAYLWHWLGMAQAADLEPKPGMPPTPGHLQRVLQATRAVPLRAVVVSLYQDVRPAQWLAQQRGNTPVLQLPSTVTDDGQASDLAGLFDLLIARLLQP
ncbi:MAG TPA: zinc ABC transporter substrate-binding protein [Pseudorhodoferax sp.]|nr:zinc ABC transporter substrate-binding protein [Pseudorhodoferax sp.]